MSIREILQEKGSDVLTVDKDAHITEVARIMRDKNISALLVEDDGKLCGIVTERDIVCTLGKFGCDLEGLRVEDIMVRTEHLMVAEADDHNEHIMAIMVEKGIRHMPIVEDGEIVGLITIRDVVRDHVKKLQAQIRYFSDLIK